MTILLGIDAGSTVTKTVAFDPAGRILAQASARVPHSIPAPHQVERDADAVWAAVIQTVRQCLTELGRTRRDPAGDVAGIGVTSHGDGVYLVDEQGRATRPGIMSLDTRARSIADAWAGDGTAAQVQRLTGQRPWASAPATLLAWVRDHEPDVLARSRYALACKDVLRQRLTGTFGTDFTEASTSFTNVRSQAYDDEVLDLFGLADHGHLRPPILACAESAGGLTAEAAAALGLRPGTPVAGSAHDVDCGAIGTGVQTPGTVSVIAGSFSINQCVSLAPLVDDRWIARNFVEPGRWLNMSLSPTSATTMEWFTQTLCAADLAAGAAAGDPFGFIERDVAQIAADPSEVVFLPFLFGSPHPQDASATFLGLRGWHGRGHLLRAVMEGVAFTHRHHVDLLAAGHPVYAARLTGGASRSTRWAQIFADVLRMPVEVTDCPEASALGVAQLAGVAAGVFDDVAGALHATVRVANRFEPSPDADALDAGYRRYTEAVSALRAFWPASG